MPIFQNEPERLRRFRRGDRDALELVYRSYVGDVWRLLRAGFVSGGLTGTRVPPLPDSSGLLDTVQDVFVKAFSEAARLSYDGQRPYRPYLLRIACNARIDTLRRGGREVLVADAGDTIRDDAAVDFDALVDSDASLSDPAETLDWQEQQVLTRAYVAGLSAEEQTFVTLRFVDELAQLEVAQRMSITRRRVRTLEAQVLRGLRRVIAGR